MSAALLDSFLSKRSPDAGFEDAEALEETERPSFLLPSVADPASYAAHRFGVYTGDKEKELPYFMTKGTTTLSFIYSGGVIVSVDSRSTQGPYIGAFVS
jgi:20S proteasome subunit beta 5